MNKKIICPKIKKGTNFIVAANKVLKSLNISPDAFSSDDLELLGECIMFRYPIEIGRIHKNWYIKGKTNKNKGRYFGHYRICGTHVTNLRENPGTSLSKGSSTRIFNDGREVRSASDCRRFKKGRGPHCKIEEKIKYDQIYDKL